MNAQRIQTNMSRSNKPINTFNGVAHGFRPATATRRLITAAVLALSIGLIPARGAAGMIEVTQAMCRPEKEAAQVWNAFAGSVGCDKNPDFFVGTKQLLNLPPSVPISTAMDCDDGGRVSQNGADAVFQIVECIPVLREDDNLALTPLRILHLGRILQDF